MSIVHDFDERLRFSEEASHEDFWGAVYRKAFPTLINHMPCPGDTISQRMGIDRVLELDGNKTLKIDEKKRETVYQDVLLEYVSNDQTNAPGWIEKDLAIDYIAYAFMPTRSCLLLPWHELKRAWRIYGEQWKRNCKRVEAQNRTYKTISVAVPISALQGAIAKASLIQV